MTDADNNTQLLIKISSDIASMKADLTTFKETTSDNTKRILALEKQPGTKAQAVVDMVYKLVLTGLIGYIGSLIVEVLKHA